MISRRAFVTTAVCAIVWPLTAEAQEAARLVTIGILANHGWPPINSFRGTPP
jgi:hypothetical protein